MKKPTTLRKHAYVIYSDFSRLKNDNFQFKKFAYFHIFAQNIDCGHIFAQNIDCGYTLEPPQ